MNPETSTLQSHVWFVMRWLDTRLKWVPTNYENISTVHLAPSKVWHPDIMVYNSVQHFDYEMTDLLVTSTGTVSVWMEIFSPQKFPPKPLNLLRSGGFPQ